MFRGHAKPDHAIFLLPRLQLEFRLHVYFAIYPVLPAASGTKTNKHVVSANDHYLL